MKQTSRRNVLKAGGLAIAALAGCSQTDDSGDETSTSAYTDTPRNNSTESATETTEAEENLEGWEKVASMNQGKIYEEAHSFIPDDSTKWRVNDYQRLLPARKVAERKFGTEAEVIGITSYFLPEGADVDRTDDVFQSNQVTDSGVGGVLKNTSISDLTDQELIEGNSYERKEGDHFIFSVEDSWAAVNRDKDIFLSAETKEDNNLSNDSEIRKLIDLVEAKDSSMREHVGKINITGGTSETALEYNLNQRPLGTILDIPQGASLENYAVALMIDENGVLEREFRIYEGASWEQTNEVRHELSSEEDYSKLFGDY
jgi:hypothetical protein